MIEFFRQLQQTGLLWPTLLFWAIVAGLAAWTQRSPIFRAELLLAGRKNRQFLVRVLYALALTWVLWVSYESQFGGWRYGDGVATHRQMAEFARNFYVWFAWVQMLAVLLVTPALVGGTIATEREQKTIEYLFASDLTDTEIVLGKLGTKVLQLGMLLATALPVLAIATLFGGISAENLVVAFGVAACTGLSLSGLALTFSIWSKRARDAVVGTYLVLLAFLILPGMLYAMFGRWAIGATVLDNILGFSLELLYNANPLVLLGQDTFNFGGGGRSWAPLYQFAAVHLAFGLLAIAWATWSVRRAHRWLAGSSVARERKAWRLLRWRPGVFDQAMLWKEVFAERWRLGWIGFIALLAVVGAVVVCQPPQYRWGGQRGEVGMLWSTMTACCLLLVQAARASMSITSERERDTWTSLMSTPLTAQEIVLGKIAGSIASVRWLELLLPYAWFLAFFHNPEFLLALPLHVFTIAVLTCFVTALGVYISLWCRTSTRAICTTVGVLIFLGGAYLMCCIPCMMGMSRGPGDEALLVLAPCLTFLISMSGFLGLERGLRNEANLGVALVGGIFLYCVATGFLLGYGMERLAKEERRGD